MALLTDSLQRFTLQQSDDAVKTDLELTCDDCGTVVCDVEAGDNLKILAEVADDHVCPAECTGCNRDLQGRLAHYGTCPLAPKVPDALLSEADAAYDREDQEWFNRQSTEHLVAMWALCITINPPSWDDEVYDALAARGHWDTPDTTTEENR